MSFFDDTFAGGGCGLGFPPVGNRRANSFVVSLVEGIMLVKGAYESVERGLCGVCGVKRTKTWLLRGGVYAD